MSQIAIIGTPSAGKTVFLSVLAMRYRRPAPGQPWLQYLNNQTQHYVAEAWDTLQNMEWPSSTPVGTFPQLEWALHTPDGQKHHISVRDPAGQDIQAIYDGLPERHTDQQKDLKQVVDSADVVLFLVNLRDVINAAGQRQIARIEVPLKMAMQDVLRRDACVALLLTQHDSFADYLQKALGDAHSDANRAVQEFLPQLGGLMQTHRQQVSAFYTAAVAETAPVTEADGKTYRRPKHGFKSEGLGPVLTWIENVLPAVAERENERVRAEAERVRQAQLAEAAHHRQEQADGLAASVRKKWGGLVAALVISAVVALCIGGCVDDSKFQNLNAKAVRDNISKVLKQEYIDNLSTDDYAVTRAANAAGDNQNVTFFNKSKVALTDVTIQISIVTGFWGNGHTNTITIKQIDDGDSATANDVYNYWDSEWANRQVTVSCSYSHYVDQTTSVHDDTKDADDHDQAWWAGASAAGWVMFGCGVLLTPGFLSLKKHKASLAQLRAAGSAR